MNSLKTQQNLSALCHKQAVNLSTIHPSLHQLFLSLVCLLLFVPLTSQANEEKRVAQILALTSEPSGVIIEIATDGGDNLEWALPRAKGIISLLRKRFPNLPVAIVSHGDEQFALSKDNQADYKEVHQLVKGFGKQDVPLHVCGTFAGWRGLSADDFPKYVNVAAAGPAQVNDYIAIGYELILINEE
ncbi:DsrE family protein [Beggiatoa alba]|nr:DsrE family protein [Beggiatoa alba]